MPPSGPMDALAFRLGNALVGNGEGAAGLEFAITGPTLRFHVATTVRRVLRSAFHARGRTHAVSFCLVVFPHRTQSSARPSMRCARLVSPGLPSARMTQ